MKNNDKSFIFGLIAIGMLVQSYSINSLNNKIDKLTHQLKGVQYQMIAMNSIDTMRFEANEKSIAYLTSVKDVDNKNIDILFDNIWDYGDRLRVLEKNIIDNVLQIVLI